MKHGFSRSTGKSIAVSFICLVSLFLNTSCSKKTTDDGGDELAPLSASQKVSTMKVALPATVLRETIVAISNPSSNESLSAQAQSLVEVLRTNCAIETVLLQSASDYAFGRSVSITSDIGHPNCPVAIALRVTSAVDERMNGQLSVVLNSGTANAALLAVKTAFGAMREMNLSGHGVAEKTSSTPSESSRHVIEQWDGKITVLHHNGKKESLDAQYARETQDSFQAGAQNRTIQHSIRLKFSDFRARQVLSRYFDGAKLAQESMMFNGKAADSNEVADLQNKAASTTDSW
jgi:hypothetical protein